MLWLQGWSTAPAVARRARDSFKLMNPDWNLLMLDASNYAELIPNNRRWLVDLEDQIPAAAFSDLIRVEILRARGGVWVDATVVTLRPLDEWLPLAMRGGFFAFRDPGPDRPLSTWFLAADPAHVIVAAWADAARDYWRGRVEPDEYHWFHYEFRSLVADDPEFALRWDAVPYLAASVPHHLLPHHRRLPQPPSPHDKGVFAGDTAPVLKLTHKLNQPTDLQSNFQVVLGKTSNYLMHSYPEPNHSLRVSVAGSNDGLCALVREFLATAGREVDDVSPDVTVNVSLEQITVAAAPGASIQTGSVVLGFSGRYITYPTPWSVAPLHLPIRPRPADWIVGVVGNLDLEPALVGLTVRSLQHEDLRLLEDAIDECRVIVASRPIAVAAALRRNRPVVVVGSDDIQNALLPGALHILDPAHVSFRTRLRTAVEMELRRDRHRHWRRVQSEAVRDGIFTLETLHSVIGRVGRFAKDIDGRD